MELTGRGASGEMLVKLTVEIALCRSGAHKGH